MLALRFNDKTKAKELIESLSYKDLNLKNYDIRKSQIVLRF